MKVLISSNQKMLQSCSKQRAIILKDWRLNRGRPTETTETVNMEFCSSKCFLSHRRTIGCFESVKPARLHIPGRAKTGGPTEWFSTRRWLPWTCWTALCLCWTTWARTLWPAFIKRSSEAVRTNGPPIFLKTSSNMLWSVREFGPVCFYYPDFLFYCPI